MKIFPTNGIYFAFFINLRTSILIIIQLYYILYLFKFNLEQQHRSLLSSCKLKKISDTENDISDCISESQKGHLADITLN